MGNCKFYLYQISIKLRPLKPTHTSVGALSKRSNVEAIYSHSLHVYSTDQNWLLYLFSEMSNCVVRTSGSSE